MKWRYFLLGVLFGLSLVRSPELRCPEVPNAEYKESVTYSGQKWLNCIFIVRYVRPMHRDFPKLTAEERRQFELEKK